jgi:hypothetical protein
MIRNIAIEIFIIVLILFEIANITIIRSIIRHSLRYFKYYHHMYANIAILIFVVFVK